MPNQYSKLTRQNILRKIERKKNPVTSMAQLAREFGYSTYSGWGTSTAAPPTFRRKVRHLVGTKVYNKIRDGRYVNHSYK